MELNNTTLNKINLIACWMQQLKELCTGNGRTFLLRYKVMLAMVKF